MKSVEESKETPEEMFQFTDQTSVHLVMGGA